MEQICSEQNVIMYIEQELPENEMLRLEKHLGHCSQCLELLDEHRLIRNALNHACAIEVDASFAANVMADIPAALHHFLTTSRERMVALAAGIVMATFAFLTYFIGVQAQRLEDILSINWWNGVFFNMFSVVTESFMFVMRLVKILGSVGLFVLEGIAFILRNLASVLIFSPQGRMLFLTFILLFISTWIIFHWTFQLHSRKLKRVQSK